MSRGRLLRAIPALQALESRWESIRDEALAMRDRTFPWGNQTIYDGDWRVGPFWSHGTPVSGRFRRACPQTVEALEGLAETRRLATAGISMLRPGATLHPHRHFDDWALRVFLPLSIPDGDVGFEVDGQRVELREGELYGWAPTAVHRAWNHSEADRLLLLVDVFRPDQPIDRMRERMNAVRATHGSTRHRDAGFSAEVS